MRRILLTALLVIAPALPCGATELVQNDADHFELHVDGSSYHFKPDNQNYENYGIGVSYPIGRLASQNSLLDGSRLDVEFDAYRDSYREPAYVGGFVLTRKLWGPVDWGLKAGLVHSVQLLDSGKAVYPYLLPFVESAFKFPVNVRVTLVPPWGSYTNGELTFQLIVDPSKF